MEKLLLHIFENLKLNPEITSQERLSFKELREFVILNRLKENWAFEKAKQGITELDVSNMIFQLLITPKLKNQTWATIAFQVPNTTFEFAMFKWLAEIDNHINNPEWFQNQIDAFGIWEIKMKQKYPKLNFLKLDRQLLLNIWVDYLATKEFLERIPIIPKQIKSEFFQVVNSLLTLIFNAAELFDEDISIFKVGKGAIYGPNRNNHKFRIPVSLLNEIRDIIVNIKDINSRYLNKELDKVWLFQFEKEISKIDITLVQKGTLKKIKQTVQVNSGISERLHYDLLNDFLLALKFKKAISEEDEEFFLKKEGIVADTIRQMKKRVIEEVIVL